jgi:hypothetical protein
MKEYKIVVAERDCRAALTRMDGRTSMLFTKKACNISVK